MTTILEILNRVAPGVNFSESSNFIDDYLLDSFAILELVAELEKEYGIVIPPAEIIPDNLSSIQGMESLVEKLKRA